MGRVRCGGGEIYGRKVDGCPNLQTENSTEMAQDIKTLSWRARMVFGLGCIALGCYPVALGLGFFPGDEAGLNSPAWVVAGAGFAFVIAGLMILLANHSRANDFLAGILLLIFGSIGVWVSLFSSNEGFSGGLFFLSHKTNITLGRWLFGLGSLISFSLCAYAFRRALRGSDDA